MIRVLDDILRRRLQVEVNGLTDVLERFLARATLRPAALQRRTACGKVAVFATFNHDLECHARRVVAIPILGKFAMLRILAGLRCHLRYLEFQSGELKICSAWRGKPSKPHKTAIPHVSIKILMIFTASSE